MKIYAKAANSSIGSVTIIVNVIEANPTSITMCDNGFGEAYFNLSRVNDYVNGGASTAVNWFKYSNASGWIAAPSNFLSAPTTVYAKVSDGICDALAPVELTIGELTANSTTITMCDDGFGYSTFYLSDENNVINGGSGHDVLWFTNADGTGAIDPSSYSSEDATIYAQVFANNDCQSDLVEVYLKVEQLVASSTSISSCGGVGEGTEFDLTTLDQVVNNGTNNRVSWFEDVNMDAPISLPEAYVPSTYFNGVASVYAEVCGDIVEVQIFLRIGDPLAVNVINSEVLMEFGDTYTIETDIDEDVEFSWIPATNLDDAQIQEPEVQANSTLTYTVNVTDEYGCTASDTIKIITVDNIGDIQPVAQIFSPNGDGNNDEIVVNIEGACEIQFKVFNRWGKQVFESTEVGAGWDGTLNRDKPAPSDSYKYVATVVLCGEDTERIYTGELVLIR